MAKKYIVLGMVIAILAWYPSGIIAAFNLHEELADDREGDMPIVITHRAALSESQKTAIKEALVSIFNAQTSSTGVYKDFVKAVDLALANAEVARQGSIFFNALKDFIRVFCSHLRVSGLQAAKLRDFLEAIQALVRLEYAYMENSIKEDFLQHQKEYLQKRLARHLLPVGVALNEVFSSVSLENQQKNILILVIKLLDEILSFIPQQSMPADAGDPPLVSEPFVSDASTYGSFQDLNLD
jgi:hypothetical protein